MSEFMPALVLLPLAGALLIPWLCRSGRSDPAQVGALIASATVALALLCAAVLASGRAPLVIGWPWIPSLGVRLALRLDALACLAALLIAVAATLALVRVGRPSTPSVAGPALALAAIAALEGAVLADDLIVLIACWEAGALATSFLVGATAAEAGGRLGARLAVAVSGAGTLALLAAVLLIGDAAGGYQLSELPAAGASLRVQPLYALVLPLVLAAACSRLVQWPLQAGMPALTSAASAARLLHAATSMIAGVYLPLRLEAALGGTVAWRQGLALAAAATLLTGSVAALVGPERLLAGWRGLGRTRQTGLGGGRPGGRPP